MEIFSEIALGSYNLLKFRSGKMRKLFLFLFILFPLLSFGKTVDLTGGAVKFKDGVEIESQIDLKITPRPSTPPSEKIRLWFDQEKGILKIIDSVGTETEISMGVGREGQASRQYRVEYNSGYSADWTGSETFILSDDIAVPTAIATITHAFVSASATDVETQIVYELLVPAESEGTYDPYLKSLWKFEGNLNDTISGLNLSPIGTPTYSGGIIGQCVKIDSSNYALRLDIGTELDMVQSTTVGGWFKFEGNLGILFGKASESWGYDGLCYYGNLTPQIIKNGSYTGSFTPMPSSWFHWVIVYDKSNAVVKSYVNGVEKTSASTSSISPVDTSEPFYIGRRSDGWSINGNLYIDELFFFTRALSTEEVAKLYHDGTPQPGDGWSWSVACKITPGVDNEVSIPNTWGKVKLRIRGSNKIVVTNYTLKLD